MPSLPKTLVDKIEEILKNPFNYKWELQGFGMLRTYIEEDTRLQIWSKNHIVENVTDIHTHPWDFTSIIYQGEIINHTFGEHDLNSSVVGEKFDRCLILTGEKAYVKEKTPIKLNKWTLQRYKKGEVYFHAKNIPHRINFVDGTITILIKRSINPDSLAYSYVKDKEEWVSAAPRIATIEEIEEFIGIAKKLKEKEE